jgi:hypothetical protein
MKDKVYKNEKSKNGKMEKAKWAGNNQSIQVKGLGWVGVGSQVSLLL